MKTIWIKKQLKCSKFSEISYNEQHERYYFVAQSEQEFDASTGTLKSGESVVVGNEDKEAVEQYLQGIKHYLSTPNEKTGIKPKFVIIEKNEKVHIDDDDDTIAE